MITMLCCEHELDIYIKNEVSSGCLNVLLKWLKCTFEYTPAFVLQPQLLTTHLLVFSARAELPFLDSAYLPVFLDVLDYHFRQVPPNTFSAM